MATSTAILVSENVKKDVVYSAECFDQSCKSLDSSTQLVVEYSVMDLERKHMAPGDLHDVIRHIDGSIDVIKGCLKIGSFYFVPAAPILLGIAQAGSYIQTLIKLIPDGRPDPVVEKYKQLEKAIHKLEDQMVAHFADMQSFITEHNFNINITTQASTLMMFMRNCIKHQDEVDVENFSDAYEHNSPLSLAYSMASLLENQSTNPLLVAMSKEKGKTKKTFNKWKTIITGILSEFLFIETFASGLLNKSDFNRNKIVDQWNELTNSLQQWENKYTKDQGYWDELKEFLEPYIENHTYLNNYQKASELKEKLDSYLTSDTFYVCVFNEVKWNRDYFYICDNEKDQIIGAWRKGKCNCFIYRSRQGSTVSQDDHQSLMKEVIERGSKNLRWTGNLQSVIQNQLVDQGLFFGNGFICLFFNTCDVEILHSVSPPPSLLRYGPGYYSFAFMDGSDVSKIMTIMAAFP